LKKNCNFEIGVELQIRLQLWGQSVASWGLEQDRNQCFMVLKFSPDIGGCKNGAQLQLGCIKTSELKWRPK